MIKLKPALLTIIAIIVFSCFVALFYNYTTQTIYALIGVIILMFVRHTYVAIEHLTNK